MKAYCRVFLNNAQSMFSMTASSKSNSLERVINQILGSNTAILRHPTNTQANFVMQVQTSQMRFISYPDR